MNFRNLFAGLAAAAFCASPFARAHDWHRHDDPQFANAPFISPYAAGPKAGAVRLLASAKDYSSQGSDAGGTPPSFAPPTLDAANLFAQAYLKFNPAVRFWWNTTNFFVESDGFPAHGMMEGIYSWQRQIPLPKYYFGTNIWALPLYPVPSGTNVLIDTNRFTQGAIALAANGIPIFNPYNNTGKISAQIGELDYWGGHCGRGDDYHYHAAPLHLTNTLGIALPLAFGMDGYPVYGLVEPDGAALNTNTLDNVRGHTNGTGTYHYHASTGFPYVNGGFHGVINEILSTNGQGQVVTQAGVQPGGQGPRPSGTPLNGAVIATLTNIGVDQYQMFFSLPSNAPPTNYWLWTLNRASNTVTVTYSPYDTGGGVTTTNYNNWKPAPAFTSTNEPLVTTQPTNLTLAAGSTASFSITAAGAGTLAYQWFKDGVELSDGGRISGVNTTNLTVTNVQPGDAGAYSAVVTNSVGNTLSLSAILTVNGSPTNTPPTLSPIANRIVIPGQTLLITNSASDAETPGLLTFSLNTTPATSATINPTNGLITWATTTNNANTTNTFTVVVADNGSPNLLATQSCTVTVVGTRSISQGRATTLVTNLFPAGQRVSDVGSITAFDGTVWTMPASTLFATAPKLPDLWNQTAGVTPTNIAAATNIASLPVQVIDADGEVITGYIYGDNYFELYVNGVLVGVDPVPYTPFNSCVVKFKARRPITYAVRLVDWEENLALGTELNGTNANHAGDGGFIASFSDGTVTGPNWKAQSFYISPLDDPNLVVEMPDGSHNSSGAANQTTLGTNAYALHYLVPENWSAKNFNHSNWPAATTFTAAQVGVNNQWAYLNFPNQFSNSGAQFIWSGNLVLDNEVIVRFTGPASNTAPVFTALPTNRFILNGGDTLVVTNTATDADVPPQTLTYSLLTAPGGVTINPSNGVVTWMTTTNNSGTSNLFRVVATDNGSPNLSATNSFNVFVRSLKPNIFVIVTDDQGWGDVSSHGGVAATPNMDRIGSEGIRLERFYPTPVCSVTRSTLLSGRSPNRTSVNNQRGLDLHEHIMPVTFKSAGYQTYMCGKWHLGGLYNNDTNTVINGITNTVIREAADYQPQNRGWDTHYGEYTGAIGYSNHISQEFGTYDWWLNGQTNLDAGWSTDLLANKAIQLFQQRDPSKPAIVYLAFNAVHGPVSAPTSYLNKYPSATGNRKATLAALDQMDEAMGRVLDAIDAEGVTTNTLVVYFSDNGGQAASGGTNAPLRGDKGDLFDGGIHTPAAVRWTGVLPSGVTNCQQFMWVGDWFPTLCAAAGVTPLNTKTFDGTNMWPLLLAATNGPFNPASYRGGPFASGSTAGSGIFNVFTNTNGVPTMFKLIRDKLPAGSPTTFTNYLFDIVNDPYESNDVVNVPAYAGIFASLSNYYNTLTTERYPPYIGAHPQSQTVPAGTNVTLWAMSTIYAKPGSVQWRKNGTNIVGATNYNLVDTDVFVALLNFTNVQTSDAASYDVVFTDNANGWGTTTSNSFAAVLTVTAPGSNTAPLLGVISNRTVIVGVTMLVTNAATDAEVPPQVLTYTLPIAPTNATINVNTGVISWTPTAGQANTTNTFTTVATDNGSPNLSATNSFLVTVLSNVSPFLTISGVAISPAAPTSIDTVWVTGAIASSTTVTQAVLSYSTGAGGVGTTNFVFIETMAAISNAAWDGTGTDNLWAVVTTGGAGNIKQQSNANHTAVGAGGQCGMEMGKGTTNASENMVTTASNINATGASGYVEFWLQTVNVTNGLGWNFQLSTNGTTFTTRLSETDGTVHGMQKYHYDLLASELVSTLKLRFQFIGNAVGGPTGPKVRVDDIVVATTTAGGAAYTNVAMLDDGAHQDGAAGDGVYGAQIPAFPNGTTVSYFVTAANSGGLAATNPVGAPATNYSYTVTSAVSSNITYNIVLGRPTGNSISASVLASNDLQVYFEYGTNSGAYTAQTATNAITNGVPRHLTMDSLQPNTRYYYRMQYSATGGPPFTPGPEGKFATQRSRGSAFTFLIEADPHNRDNVPDVWKLAFTNMLADNADFLMDLGDTFFEEKVAATNAFFLTQPGIYATHQEVRDGFFGLAGHSLPLFLVGGNHDPELGWLATGTNSAPVWAVQARQYYFPTPVPNQFYTGATNIDALTGAPRDGYYAFEWGDALFVGLDPYWYSSPKPNADGWSWTLGTNQYYWLKRTLENSTAKFKFVFAHHLIGGGGGGEARGGLTYHTNFEWGGSTTNGGYDFPTKRPGWPAPIKDLLLSNNVQVFFHGHDHLYVKEEYFAPGNTSAVPTFIYQEVPQPSQTIYGTNAAPGYGYTNASSVVLPSSGHLRVTVSPTNTHVDYIRVFRPVDEGAGKTNKMISHSYDIPLPLTTNGPSMLKLPDTGQVADYTPAPGEDSDYAINTQSFTDNGNGTITDNITGLMWQKADGGEITLSNALLYPATNLNAAYFAGFADWRVPTVHELMSLLNHDKVNPALDTNYFTSPGVSGATWGQVYWWSRDQRVGSTNQWCANAGGGVGPKPLSETISAGGVLNYRIRCVRGASVPSSARVRFVNNGNGTITDTDTGLIWQQGEIGAATDWTNALAYCESLVLGGFQDWRLPNLKELESLNDETRASPSMDTNFFPGAKSARYWSSTTQFGHATNAWWNEFINGITSYEGTKTTNYWVRAVRGAMTNTAPNLTAISNLAINAGVTMQFTNTATDAQTAPGFLTFSLLTSLSNASLGASNGVFTWRPAVAQAGTTNLFTVVVADSGSPILSATQLFSITVNPLTNPPGVAALTYVGSQLQLQVTGDAGPDYTVQATTNLASPTTWTNLFTTNSPATPFLWLDPNTTGYTSRFYRVLLGP